MDSQYQKLNNFSDAYLLSVFRLNRYFDNASNQNNLLRNLLSIINRVLDLNINLLRNLLTLDKTTTTTKQMNLLLTTLNRYRFNTRRGQSNYQQFIGFLIGLQIVILNRSPFQVNTFTGK